MRARNGEQHTVSRCQRAQGLRARKARVDVRGLCWAGQLLEWVDLGVPYLSSTTSLAVQTCTHYAESQMHFPRSTILSRGCSLVVPSGLRVKRLGSDRVRNQPGENFRKTLLVLLFVVGSYRNYSTRQPAKRAWMVLVFDTIGAIIVVGAGRARFRYSTGSVPI